MFYKNYLFVLLGCLLVSANLSAEIRADKVHAADSKKTNAYIKDGVIVGGDKAIDGVVIKTIRRGINSGFDRIVIDIEGNRNGEPVAISRPPYFQVAVSPEEHRIVFTIWGKPQLAFDAKKTAALFRKSPAIKAVQLFPRVEEDSWTFVMDLKSEYAAEVFELVNPARIIADIRLVP